MNQSGNIKDLLKGSPTTPVEVHEQDAQAIAGIKEFLAAHQGPEPENPAAKITIPPNDDFNQPTPDAAFMREAFVPVDNIDVTEEEKRTFLKALLADVPVRFSVSIFGGQLSYDMRSRTHYEQQRVIDVLNWEFEKRKTESPGQLPDTSREITAFQHYCALLMVERVNKTLFSDLTLEAGPSLDAHSTMLKTLSGDKFDTSKTGTIRWTATLNAMRMFEAKCARMCEMAANEDFWKPRG